MPTVGRTTAVTSTATAAPVRELETRLFGSLAVPLHVTLAADGRKGSFVAEVPLSSFKPPLPRNALAGLSLKVGMPPSSDGVQPATVVERDGAAMLRVELKSGDVAALRGSPLVVALGDAANLGDQVSVPAAVLQVNITELRVDGTAPRLALEREDRTSRAARVTQLEAARAGMINGTSSWFGGMQLKLENERNARELQRLDAELRALLAPGEAALRVAPMHEVALTAPQEADGLRAAAGEVGELRNAVIKLEQKRKAFEAVPSALPALDAELAAAREKFSTADAAARKGYLALYDRLSAEEPAKAQRWVAEHGKMTGRPGAADLGELIVDRTMLANEVEVGQRQQQQIEERQREAAPVVIERLTKDLAEAKEQLRAQDALVERLENRTEPMEQRFTTEYPPEKKFI